MVQGRKAKEKPSDEALREFAEKHNHANLVKRVKIEFHVGEPTARKWLEEAGLIKPKQTSKPEQAANQEPAQSEASAQEIIAHGETNEMLVKCSECGLESKVTEKYRKHITLEGKEVCWFCYHRPGWNASPNYTPTDNDYNEEPQRTTITRAQYDEMAGMNDDRRDALGIYCEQQAVESMIQGWAADIFKHSTLSIEKKLELTRQLLEWEVGA